MTILHGDASIKGGGGEHKHQVLRCAVYHTSGGDVSRSDLLEERPAETTPMGHPARGMGVTTFWFPCVSFLPCGLQ